MYWGFGENKRKRGRLATDVSSGPIFLTHTHTHKIYIANVYSDAPTSDISTNTGCHNVPATGGSVRMKIRLPC